LATQLPFKVVLSPISRAQLWYLMYCRLRKRYPEIFVQAINSCFCATVSYKWNLAVELGLFILWNTFCN